MKSTFALTLMLLSLLTTRAAAQGVDTAPAAAPSMTPLIIMTTAVLVAVTLLLWLVPKARPRHRTLKAPPPDAASKLSPQQQAVGAVTAFEKARLMAKKVAHAAPSDARRGGEAGDEHPS